LIFSSLWRTTLTVALLLGIASCGAQTSNEVETVGTSEVVSDESTETGVLALFLFKVANVM
jgi:hypothetical protein